MNKLQLQSPEGERDVNQSWPVALCCKKKNYKKGSLKGADEPGTKAKQIKFGITP